jgi:uncharacterized protein
MQLNKDAYLDSARQGENKWVRYLLAVGLILIMWQIVGAMPYVFLIVGGSILGLVDYTPGTGSLPEIDPLLSFTAFMLASVFFLLGIFLAVRFIHKRRFLSLITPARAIAWRRIIEGSVVWFALSALTSLIEALLYPGRYTWSFDPLRFIPFMILALIFIPIQASTEELFFRAYVLQGVGLRNRNIWLLSAISGILFMIPHLLNPEASVNYPLLSLFYFFMGAFLAYITLREGCLELALGVHIANNLFSILVANYTISVLPSPSLFTVNVLDAFYSVPSGIAGMLIFTWLFLNPLRRRDYEHSSE